MKILQKILLDIKSGSNIESYIFVMIGALLVLVSFFTNLPQGIVFSALLAGITLLVTSFISLKWMVSGDREREFSGLSSFRLTPPPLRDTLSRARSNILVMGTEISEIVRDELEFLEKKAEHGCSVRLLFMAPYDPGGQPNLNVEYQAEIVRGKLDPMQRNSLCSTTRALQDWLEVMDEKVRNNVEIKVYSHLMPFKCILIDTGNRKNALIKVEPYLFKRKTEWKPNFDIEYERSSDAFHTYERIVEDVWATAVEIDRIHIPL